jgi:septal ring factor EnvC (AmiA/AmiB activator)
MPDSNGADNTQQRLDQLEQMDKLLLRAQVLQQDALEKLEKSVSGLATSMEGYEKRLREAEEREKRLDGRIDKLVSSIADLVSRIPPESLR